MFARKVYKGLGFNASSRQASRALNLSSPRVQYPTVLTKFTIRAMATATKVHLSSSQSPAFFVPGISDESAQKTSELLQKNHEQTHIFFNNEGFHVSKLAPLEVILTDTLRSEPHCPPPPHPLCAQGITERDPERVRRERYISTPNRPSPLRRTRRHVRCEEVPELHGKGEALPRFPRVLPEGN
jgi:hypothetical protein